MAVLQRHAPSGHSTDVPLQIPGIGLPPAAEVGVGPGSEAHILPAGLVLQVVAGLLPRLGEVGDLVLPEEMCIRDRTDAEARKRGEQTGLDTLVVHAEMCIRDR